MTWDKRDRNGRILGWVMDPEGIWVNKVMVLTGYAWWFERYAPDEGQLREAQEAAQEKKPGLWAEPIAGMASIPSRPTKNPYSTLTNPPEPIS